MEQPERYVAFLNLCMDQSKVHELGLENLVRWLKTLEWGRAHLDLFKRSKNGVILLVVYVDDILIIGYAALGIQSLKTFLHN